MCAINAPRSSRVHDEVVLLGLVFAAAVSIRPVVAGERICAEAPLKTFYARRNNEVAWSDANAHELIDAISHADEDGLRSSDYHLEAIRSVDSPEDRDLLLTDAFLLFATHLLAGRVDPNSIEPTWCLEPRANDVVASLETSLAEQNVREMLARLAPSHAGYRRLREELARLRAAALRGEPVGDRIRQVELNLERWRWLPASLGSRYVLVNIPEFHLSVIENERDVLSMRIVVGKEYQQTPVFSAAITQVVFSPYWNVPDSIAEKEIRPKIRRNSSYLRREHMEIVNGRIRQRPGPWNSLGLIKFNMPNRYDVYLHDTPARSLFDETARAFSHGCMRVEKPVDLAMLLLGWERDRVVAESKRGKEKFVDLASPVPVHVLYWTAYVGEDDELHFAPDVYHRDEVLDRAMRLPPPSSPRAPSVPAASSAP